jgi:hypothetical protein
MMMKGTPMTTRHTLPAQRLARMRHAAAELTPHAIEQVAQRVAQLLNTPRHEHTPPADARPAPARLLDATQLARHLGVTRTWVYEHAQQLGAIRLGAGTKARLRFDLDTATAAIKRLHEKPPTDAAASEAPRRGRPRRRQQATIPLLPVHEPRTRGILARIRRRR